MAATDVDALVVISYNDPDPAAYAKKLLKEFPQWSAARNNTYVTLSDSMYLGPSNDVAVEKIAKMLHPERSDPVQDSRWRSRSCSSR